MTEENIDVTKVWSVLGSLSDQQEAIDNEVSAYNTKKLQPYYAARRSKLLEIPDFWSYAVRGSAELLDQYSTAEDISLLMSLKDLYVEWDNEKPDDFVIEFVFHPNKYLDDDSLTLRKTFTYRAKKTSKTSSKGDDDEDEEDKKDAEEDEKEPWYLQLLEKASKRALQKDNKVHVSDPVAIKWKKGQNLTRLTGTGINSLFGWFGYVGEGPGDFPSGDDLTRIIVEQLFPFATEYYLEGVKDQAQVEAEYDLDEDEEEDIGDDDADEVKNKKKHSESDEEDEPSKKKAKTE